MELTSSTSSGISINLVTGIKGRDMQLISFNFIFVNNLVRKAPKFSGSVGNDFPKLLKDLPKNFFHAKFIISRFNKAILRKIINVSTHNLTYFPKI